MDAQPVPEKIQVSRRKFPRERGPKDALLLVEGSDDYHFLFHFMEIHALMGICTVFEGTGIENLLDEFNVRLKATDIKQIGVVIDADTATQPRWESIKTILRKNNYPNTKALSLQENGTVIREDGLPTIGIWIMPDNLNSGMIEDFVKTLIPSTDMLWPLAAKSVDSIPDEQRLFIPEHTTKAKVHTWLAWQEEPGIPMGLALTKTYLDAKAPPAVALAAWMSQLFSPSLE